MSGNITHQIFLGRLWRNRCHQKQERGHIQKIPSARAKGMMWAYRSGTLGEFCDSCQRAKYPLLDHALHLTQGLRILRSEGGDKGRRFHIHRPPRITRTRPCTMPNKGTIPGQLCAKVTRNDTPKYCGVHELSGFASFE